VKTGGMYVDILHTFNRSTAICCY